MNDQSSQVNPKKLFVGNLPFNTTQDELVEVFAQHGEIVEAKLVTDRMSGRSKGIAFIEFSTEEDAAKAMEALNNTELGGRTIFVSVARPFVPLEYRPQGGGFGGGRRGGGYDRNRGGDRGGRGGYDRNDSQY